MIRQGSCIHANLHATAKHGYFDIRLPSLLARRTSRTRLSSITITCYVAAMHDECRTNCPFRIFTTVKFRVLLDNNNSQFCEHVWPHVRQNSTRSFCPFLPNRRKFALKTKDHQPGAESKVCWDVSPSAYNNDSNNARLASTCKTDRNGRTAHKGPVLTMLSHKLTIGPRKMQLADSRKGG